MSPSEVNFIVTGNQVKRLSPRKPLLIANNSLNEISVKEIVDNTLNIPPFGFDFYKSPSNEMLLKKVPFGISNKS